MLFNSFDFVVFLVVVTSLYFVLPHAWRSPLYLYVSDMSTYGGFVVMAFAGL